MGGVGPNAASPPGRSFKYWRRGEAVVDAGPREGGFAHGYRGWFGAPSSGRIGRVDGVDSTGAGLRVGAGAAIWIDRGGAGVAVAELGGAGGAGRQDHVAGSGGVARPGGASRIERGADFDAISVVGTYSAASPRVAIEVEPSSTTRFGAAARVDVEHGLGWFGGDGRAFGGGADAIATCEPAAGGSLAVGGGHIDRLALVYRIYSNGGLGGAIDYGSPIAETSGLEWTSEPLPPGSSFRFGVRTYSPVDDCQDENLDASVALVVDARGRDATGVPRPPVGLRALDQGGGRVRLEWTTGGPSRFEAAATHFNAYLGRDVVTDFPSPIVVPAPASRGGVVATELRDLPTGRSFAVIVRAANEFGEDDNVAAVRFTVDLFPPSRVDDLAASVA